MVLTVATSGVQQLCCHLLVSDLTQGIIGHAYGKAAMMEDDIITFSTNSCI